MSDVLNVLKKHVTVHEDFDYQVKALDNNFDAVEIYSMSGDLFREWYYIVDVSGDRVFFGDHTVPSGALVERIKTGAEKSI